MSSRDHDDFGLNQSKAVNVIDSARFEPRRRRKSFIPGAAAMAAWLAIIPLAGAAAVDEWALDPARTHISFSVDAIGFPRTEGEFHTFDGRIAIDFEHPAMSRVAFRVEAGSIDAGSAVLSDALRGAAFFDTVRFAEIAFVSTKVEKIDEQTVRVAGELTMLGVTRPLSVDVEVHRQSARPHARFDVKAHTTIDRLEFGMVAGYPLISRDVDLVVASEFAEY
jgi:polyisoprenoid-binding protein YceI